MGITDNHINPVFARQAPGDIGPKKSEERPEDKVFAEKKTGGEESDPVAEQKEAAALHRLRTREQEVRAHEMAHMAVGGQYAGSAHYEYTRGPDGKMYISGGEVSIDTSGGGTPEETAQKMRQVRAAAMAPASPSGADMAVAAKASAREAEAMREAASQKAEERKADEGKGEDSKAEEGVGHRGEGSQTTARNSISVLA